MNSQENVMDINEGDFNINHTNLKDVMVILLEDTTLTRKLKCIDIIISQYMININIVRIEKELFCELMLCLHEILDTIFRSATDLVLDDSDITLQKIQECLQMCLELLNAVDQIFTYILSEEEVAFENIQSLPMYSVQILHKTFLHCKESQRIYSKYFDFLPQILQLFKKAQMIHSKLLKLLSNAFFESESSFIYMNDILDNLIDIGDTLSEMNMKSMADNCKGYISLTEKHSEFYKGCIKLKKPVNFFITKILTRINELFDITEDESITYNIKIIIFLEKALVKLSLIFTDGLEVCFEDLMKFLVDLYTLTLKRNEGNKKLITIIKTQLVTIFYPLLRELSLNKRFIRTMGIIGEDKANGFLLLLGMVLKYLIEESNSNEIQTKMNEIEFCGLLETTFKMIHNSNLFLVEENDTYDDLIIYLTVLMLNLSNNNFIVAENLVCRYLFDTHSIVCNIFSYDLWISVIRYNNQQYAYDVLKGLIAGLKTVLQTHFTYRPEQIFVNQLVRRIFEYLSHEYKEKFVSQHPIEENLHLWRHIGFGHLPRSSFKSIERCLSETVRLMENFSNGQSTEVDFLQMTDRVECVSMVRFDEVYFDTGNLLTSLFSLWKIASNNDLCEYRYFDLLLAGTFRLTRSMLWRINTTQYQQVLKCAKKLLMKNNNLTRIYILYVIDDNVGKYCKNLVSKEAIYMILKDVFVNLLQEDVFFRKNIFEILNLSANNNEYSKILTGVIKEDKLERCRSVLLRNEIESIESNVSYKHKCTMEFEDVDRGEQKFKRLKIDPTTQIDDIIDKCKENVYALKEMLKENNPTTKNVADISTLIATLHSCLK